jgi:hypothetical protein
VCGRPPLFTLPTPRIGRVDDVRQPTPAPSQRSSPPQAAGWSCRRPVGGCSAPFVAPAPPPSCCAPCACVCGSHTPRTPTGRSLHARPSRSRPRCVLVRQRSVCCVVRFWPPALPLAPVPSNTGATHASHASRSRSVVASRRRAVHAQAQDLLVSLKKCLHLAQSLAPREGLTGRLAARRHTRAGEPLAGGRDLFQAHAYVWSVNGGTH